MKRPLFRPLTQPRTPALLASTIAALALLVTPARPQSGGSSTGIEIPLARTAAAAPCPGESLRLSGAIRLVVRTSPGAGGVSHTVEMLDLHDARGKGDASGADYRFEAADGSRQSIPCGPGEGCAAKALLAFQTDGEGPDDGLRGRLAIKVRQQPGGALAAELAEFKFVCAQ